MFVEIEKNKELIEKYSKYELVNIIFMILKKVKKEQEKQNKKVILTDLLDEIILDMAHGRISNEEILKVIEEEKIQR